MDLTRSSRFARAGVEMQDSCSIGVSNCEKCGAELKKHSSSCGCDTDLVCPKCGHCNYCHGTKKCQEKFCSHSDRAHEKGATMAKCKVCMDTGECQQCLYR
jgi:hypothetical protein